MKKEQVIDYQAALDEFRRNEHEPDNPVQSSGMPEKPPMVEGYVDYLAAVKAWDKGQDGQSIIHMHAGRGTQAMTQSGSETNPTHEEQLIELYMKQKHILNLFLERGAISQAQYDKSLRDMKDKMGIDE